MPINSLPAVLTSAATSSSNSGGPLAPGAYDTSRLLVDTRDEPYQLDTLRVVYEYRPSAGGGMTGLFVHPSERQWFCVTTDERIRELSIPMTAAPGRVDLSTEGDVYDLDGNTEGGLDMALDGSRYWTVDTNARTVKEYGMSAPWAVSTSTLDYSVVLNSGTRAYYAVNVRGSKLFIGASVSGNLIVEEYDLGTPGSLAGGITYVREFSTGMNGFNFFVARDGSWIDIFNDAADDIVRFTLGPAFTLTAPVASGDVFGDANQFDSTGRAICWNLDGSALYGAGVSNDTIRGAVHVKLGPVLQGTSRDIFWHPTGNEFYILRSNNRIETWSTQSPHEVDGATFVKESVLGYTNSFGFFIRSDGLRLWHVNLSTDRIYEQDLTTAWDFDTLDTVGINQPIGFAQGAATGMAVDEASSEFWTIGTNNEIDHFSFDTAGTIANGITLLSTGAVTGGNSAYALEWVPGYEEVHVIFNNEDYVIPYLSSPAKSLVGLTEDTGRRLSVKRLQSTPFFMRWSGDGLKRWFGGGAGTRELLQYVVV